MFDEAIRRALGRVSSTPVTILARLGVTPNALTLAGGALGVAAATIVGLGAPTIGIIVWWISRSADGFDGLLARRTGRASAFGGYLDITVDMLAYSAMAVGFAVAQRELAWLWMLVLLGYTMAITTTLALSSLLERLGRRATGDRSVQFTPGLAEAGETTLVYSVIAFWPDGSRWVLLVWIAALAFTLVQRTRMAARLLR